MRMQLFGSSSHACDGSHAMSRKRLLPTVCCLLLAACATNPATGKREISLMSEAQEIQHGREADIEVQREMSLTNHAGLRQRRGATPRA